MGYLPDYFLDRLSAFKKTHFPLSKWTRSYEGQGTFEFDIDDRPNQSLGCQTPAKVYFSGFFESKVSRFRYATLLS
jgi:hypothetical protein